MRTRTLVTGTIVLLSAVAVLTAQAGEELLKQCRTKDRVDSDIPAAIKLCERVVSEFGSNRQLVADAHFELGRLYEGSDAAKAKQHYDAVLAMSDQPAKLAEAKARLKALSRDPYPEIKIPTPYTDDVFSFALSPDGLSLVYQATVDGKSQLWLWRDEKTRPIAGTENAREWALPFWSPDGRNIGFFAEQKLKIVPAEGGTAKSIIDVGLSPRGGTWSKDGVILYASTNGPLNRVLADGSEPRPLPPTDAPQNHYPRFLPDGRRFVFMRVSGGAVRTSVGVLDSNNVQLFLSGPGATLVSPDQWYFGNARGVNSLTATLQLSVQRVIEGDSLAFTGSVAGLSHSFGASQKFPGLAAVSISPKGAIAYRADAKVPRQLAWLDRNGQQTGTLGPVDREMASSMRFSVDGGTVAFNRYTGGFGSVWIMKTAGGEPFLLRDPASNLVFSPTDGEIVFSMANQTSNTLARQPLNILEGSVVQIPRTQASRVAQDVSREGQLLFGQSNPGTNEDLLAMPVKGGEATSVATGPGVQTNGRFSPDSRWVAYQSDEPGGRFEVFVQQFPGLPDSRRRVSVSGGIIPQWSRDGRELYFLSGDNRVMVVDVTPGDELKLSTPRPLFAKALRHGSTFEMAPDGKRLLVNMPVEDPAPIVLLPNGPRRP